MEEVKPKWPSEIKPLIQTVKSNYKKLTIYVFLTCILFTVSSQFLIEKEFTSFASFIPRVSGADGSSKLGKLGLLAGLAGSASGEAMFPPNLYQELLKDDVFCKKVIYSNLTFQDSTIKNLYDYLLEGKSNFRPLSFLDRFRESDKVQGFNEELSDNANLNLNTKDENYVIKQLRKKSSVKTSLTDGITEISVRMVDAYVAAQVTQLLLKLLEEEMIRYRTSASKDNLSFLRERLKESQTAFHKIQDELANFMDSNQGLSTTFAQNEVKRLESEYGVKYSIFNELALKVANTEVEVEKNTPSIYLINKPSIPLKKSSMGIFSVAKLSLFVSLLFFIALFHLKVLK